MLNSKSPLGCNPTDYIAQSLTFLIFFFLFHVLHSRVPCNSDQDLHSHGDTGDLGQGIGHRSGRCPQSAQVGDGVNHPSADKNQKVKAGYGQRGFHHGVDGSQEEEG